MQITISRKKVKRVLAIHITKYQFSRLLRTFVPILSVILSATFISRREIVRFFCECHISDKMNHRLREGDKLHRDCYTSTRYREDKMSLI